MSEAWNECMCDLVECSRAHCNYYLSFTFFDTIKKIEDKPIQAILTKLSHLFSMKVMEDQMSQYVQSGYVNSSQVPLVIKGIRILCKEVRHQAIPLVDSLGVSDLILNSPLARRDGDIYGNYLDAVKNSRGSLEVPPYWNELIRPLTSPNRP